MKKIYFLLLSCNLLFGYSAKVKKDDIKISINGIKHSYKKGNKFTLKNGDRICYRGGRGYVTILIDSFRIKLSKRTEGKCKVLGSVEIKDKPSLLSGAINQIKPTHEESQPGVSLQSVDSEDIDKIELDINK